MLSPLQDKNKFKWITYYLTVIFFATLKLQISEDRWLGIIVLKLNTNWFILKIRFL